MALLEQALYLMAIQSAMYCKSFLLFFMVIFHPPPGWLVEITPVFTHPNMTVPHLIWRYQSKLSDTMDTSNSGEKLHSAALVSYILKELSVCP